MTQDYENTLRRLILFLIGESDDADFKVTPERIEAWKNKREIEEKKYKGALYEKRLIYYSDFYDLETIVVKNWNIFGPVLGEQSKFKVLHKMIETYRNTLSHGRSIFTFQENLIIGITGDLKTAVTIYHNKNMSKEDYFIRILKLSDNLGNSWESSTGMSLGMFTDHILRVGDELELIVEAFDPKGRKITYSLQEESYGITSQSNDSGIFRIKITSKMIAESWLFKVRAETQESEYKNYESLNVGYTILP